MTRLHSRAGSILEKTMLVQNSTENAAGKPLKEESSPSGSNIFPIACDRNPLVFLSVEMNPSYLLVSNVRQSSRVCQAKPNTFVLFDPKLKDISTTYASKPSAAH
ncbi:hypothetical protein NPIL_235281 [Nephila pilipes]|uniref:Uncharacterized protein n=1 Tax=Nephila pilipes TaxID=299642 RepID=A0A8X6JH39_NEPPI|nr:hypothetical protein NPIL_235281 [Nephila pilipes]